LVSGIVVPAGAGGAPGSGGGRPITVTRLTTETGEPLTGSDLALNERGQVAATLYRTEPLESIVVLWHRGRVTRVSPDGVYAHPHDLSDRGDVVGDIYGLDQAQGHVLGPQSVLVDPFWWSRGGWRQISSDNIAGSGGLDVNRRGQVVTRRDAPPYTGVWDRGEVMLPPPAFGARRINDRGQVMGRVQNEAGDNEAATWRLGDDAVTKLGTLGGDYSEGIAINERGDIAGNSATADGEEHGFLWRDGEMIDLGTLGGVRSWVADLNDRGDVVGTSITAEGEGSSTASGGGPLGRSVQPPASETGDFADSGCLCIREHLPSPMR
jgi:probable HAF family extracellular repeat protein